MNYDLEDGVKNVMVGLGDDCDYNLDELEEMNANFEGLIRANNIHRGPNNIVEGSAAGKQGQPGQPQTAIGSAMGQAMGQAVMGQMGRPVMGQPGMGQPGMGQPGMGQPGMGQPGMMG